MREYYTDTYTCHFLGIRDKICFICELILYILSAGVSNILKCNIPNWSTEIFKQILPYHQH